MEERLFAGAIELASEPSSPKALGTPERRKIIHFIVQYNTRFLQRVQTRNSD